MANLREYALMHQPKHQPKSRPRYVDFFHTAAEALEEYEALRKDYFPERVWVVHSPTGQIIADSQRR
jgi:hypothetical protein